MTEVAPTPVRIALSAPQAVTHTTGLVFEPFDDEGRAAVVLAPGAGSDLRHPVLLELGRGLAAAGHPVLTFNFAYTDIRRIRPDPAGRLERAYADVLRWTRNEFGDNRRLFIGGRSMGGRIASRIAADGEACDGLVLLGYPLHPRPRRDTDTAPPRLRTQHWPDLRVPALFVQGDRDALCDLSLLKRASAEHLANAETTVHVVAGADHAFGVRKRDARAPADVLAEVPQAVLSWVQKHDVAVMNR